MELAPTASHRILLVDDNRDLTDSLAMLLEMAGHEVHIGSDGFEAMTKVVDVQPDIILLDISLPKLDGYTVARQIREKDKKIVLIAITGWGQEQDRRQAKEAGFNAHMIKPVEFDVLVKLLNELNSLINCTSQHIL